MVQRNIVTAAALALALTGCLESRSGTVAGDVEAPDATDTAVPADTVVPADTEVTEVYERMICDEVYLEKEPQTAPYTPWRLKVGVDGRILFSGDTWMYSGAPGVWWLDAKTGEAAPVSGSEEHDVLVDANDDAVLVLRGGGDGGVQRLVYRDDTREIALTHPSEDGERVWGDPFSFGPDGHAVAAGRAAWRSCDYDAQRHCTRSRLRGWSGGAPQTLWEAPASPAIVTPPLPEVNASGVLWAEPPPDDQRGQHGWRIRAWTGEAVVTLQEVDAQSIYRVVRLGANLVWWTEAGIWRSRGDGPVSHVATMVCGAVDSDGTQAVMLCDDGDAGGDGIIDGDWSPFPHGRGELWVYDGADDLRHVPTGGAVRVAPRVWGGVMAWITYPDVDAGCYPESAGAVMIAPVEAPAAALEIASIGVGCYCCDSIWPEVRLSLHSGTLAWNYALIGDPPASDPRGGNLGWAQPLLMCHY